MFAGLAVLSCVFTVAAVLFMGYPKYTIIAPWFFFLMMMVNCDPKGIER